MSQDKQSILRIEADTTAKESVSFQIFVQPDDTKKRKCAIRLILINDVSHARMRVRSPGFSQYGNAGGEIEKVFPIKFELFGSGGSKTLSVTLPYDALEETAPGTIVLARADLLPAEGGEPIDSVSVHLLSSISRRFASYTSGSMEKYLKGSLSPEQKISYALSWLENRDDNREIALVCLKVLEELASDTKRPQLQYRLYELYLDKEKAYHSDQKAARWLGKATQGGYRPSDKGASVESGEVDMSSGRAPAEDTIEKCIQSAKEGNSLAQWTLYEYYRRKDSSSYDEAKAFSYLKAAAENGNPSAVAILEDQFIEQHVYIQAEHVQEFLSILTKASDNRCAQADFQFFSIYYSGRCLGSPVPVNHVRAYARLKAAAENGLPDAGFALWDLYENGNRFLMETEDAVQWLVTSADGDHAAAQNRLGDLYVDGELVAKDGLRGVECIRRAAELGDPDAQIKVYRMHLEGRYKDVLIVRDADKAHDMLFAYADKGNPIAQKILWDSYADGNDLMITVSEALSYLTRSAESGYLPAAFGLATAFIQGYYTQQNLEEGHRLLEDASRDGSPEAQFALYQYYGLGAYLDLECESINKERAFKWLICSARTLAQAQYEIWRCFRQGNEMRIEKREAINHLFSSAKQGYSPAVYHVGLLFGKGKLLAKDTAKGISFIRTAVRLRNAEAMYTLSNILCDGSFEGEPVERDPVEGNRLLILSAECGYLPACYQAWELYSSHKLDIEELWADRFLQVAAKGGYEPALHKSPAGKQPGKPSKQPAAPAPAEPPLDQIALTAQEPVTTA